MALKSAIRRQELEANMRQKLVDDRAFDQRARESAARKLPKIVAKPEPEVRKPTVYEEQWLVMKRSEYLGGPGSVVISWTKWERLM